MLYHSGCTRNLTKAVPLGIKLYKTDCILKKVEEWSLMNESMRDFTCRIDLIEQAADEIFKKLKLIEEDTCVVCYSEKPSVAFFPCRHKVFCTDCHKASIENNSEQGCAFCRRSIMFYTVGS